MLGLNGFQLGPTSYSSLSSKALLFLAVIGIYNFDSYLDFKKAYKTKTSSNQPKAYAPLTSIFLTSAAALIALLLLSIPFISSSSYTVHTLYFFHILLLSSSFLLAFVLVYFYFLVYKEEKLLYVKELWVSLLFTLGLWLVPAINFIQAKTSFQVDLGYLREGTLFSQKIYTSLTQFSASLQALDLDAQPYFLSLLTCYFLILFHNALICSYANREKDKQQHQSSIMLKLSDKKATWLINSLGFFSLLYMLIRLNSLHSIFAYFLISAVAIQNLFFRLGAKLETAFYKKYFHLLMNSYFLPLSLLFYAIYAFLER